MAKNVFLAFSTFLTFLNPKTIQVELLGIPSHRINLDAIPQRLWPWQCEQTDKQTNRQTRQTNKQISQVMKALFRAILRNRPFYGLFWASRRPFKIRDVGIESRYSAMSAASPHHVWLPKYMGTNFER